MSNRIRLTDAQVSAIECRSEEEGFELVDGRFLIVTTGTAEALNEASNAEDAYCEYVADADPELKKYARRAAKSLSTLYLKALKLERGANA